MEIQWPLIIFTLFICLGAGTFGITGLLAIFGKGAEIRLPALVVSLASIVVGGIASAMHLQHWERIFNGFGNLTSGITQELIGIVLVVIAMAVFYVTSRDGKTPKWAGVLALVVSIVLVVAMSHSYAMPARPLWDNFALYVYYLANTILLGSLAVVTLLAAKSADVALPGQVAVIGGAVQTVAVIAYTVIIPVTASKFATVGNYYDSTNPTKAMQDPGAVFSGFLTDEYALLFWGGALVLGALVPLVLAYIFGKKKGTALVGLAGVGTLSALAGGVAFRAILYLLGFTAFVFY